MHIITAEPLSSYFFFLHFHSFFVFFSIPMESNATYHQMQLKVTVQRANMSPLNSQVNCGSDRENQRESNLGSKTMFVARKDFVHDPIIFGKPTLFRASDDNSHIRV